MEDFMKLIPKQGIKSLLYFSLLIIIINFFVQAELAPWTPMPTVNEWGTRGLTHTSSGKALGQGRLNILVEGTWYKQKDAFPGTLDANADIGTGYGFLALGVSNYFDVFGGANFFGLRNASVSDKYGLGTVTGGIKASLPLPENFPVYLGAQAAVLAGLSKNQINTNYIDGYNYFETRVNYDVMGKLIESVILGNENRGFELHLNQGVAKSTEANSKSILLISGGILGNIIPYLSLGLEANSRTFLEDRAFRTDPVYITPFLVIKTPAYISITAGGDISLSQDRTNDPAKRALEKYRVFGNLVFSYDFLAVKRKLALEKAKADSTERVQCIADVNNLKTTQENLKKQMAQDSAICKNKTDSLTNLCTALTKRVYQDSIALDSAKAEYKRLLAIEKERRSDLEKKLLTTGMLILDAVYFESGKTEISINSKPYLKIIGKMLERYPKLQLEVGGHTDNLGNAEKNYQLSQARADAVKNYLILVAPGLADRLSARGYGSSMPKMDNRTAAGRKANRRVELKVLNPEVLKEYN
jgi:outer membrane protein OmpA-like peptidoglycan-associated protein